MSAAEYFNDYLTLQCNFSYIVCKEIFGEDVEHYWRKYETSDRNMIYFISRLDEGNREKVFEWLDRYFLLLVFIEKLK